jgi:hypothetical protein
VAEPSALHNVVHKRFREVFGEPQSVLGREDHWSFKPTVPYSAAINVLVNGTAELPAIWVFDPHQPDDGVLRVAIKDEQMIEDIISKIQERIRRASRDEPKRPSAHNESCEAS